LAASLQEEHTNINVHIPPMARPSLERACRKRRESVINEVVVVKEAGLFSTRELFSGLVSI
jgi:hypothetical protein